MICTTHNLLKLFTFAKAAEAATVQQMPGRDAYLDGLLGCSLTHVLFATAPQGRQHSRR